MKQFLSDHELNNMTVPTVRASHHQAQLRRVLVSRATNKVDQKLTLRGVIYAMTKRNIFVGTGVAGMLAVAVLAFTVFTPAQNLSALQLAQKSSQALAQMQPNEADYKKHYPYFVEWMKQAQAASDLRLLSYDQFAAAYPEAVQSNPGSSEPLRVIDDPSDGQAPNIRELRYLEFTVVDGDTKSKVVVGVNSHDIPEAALTHIVSPGESRVGA